jgi:hypothetical protein
MMPRLFVTGYHVSEELAAPIFSVNQEDRQQDIFLPYDLLFLGYRNGRGTKRLLPCGKYSPVDNEKYPTRLQFLQKR